VGERAHRNYFMIEKQSGTHKEKQTECKTVRIDMDYDINQFLNKCEEIHNCGYLIRDIVWITPREIWIFVAKRKNS